VVAVLAVIALLVSVASVARWCRRTSGRLVSQPIGLLVSRQWRWLAGYLPSLSTFYSFAAVPLFSRSASLWLTDHGRIIL